MDHPQPHADQSDENDVCPPALIAERPYRPTDVYDCGRLSGHSYVRTMDGHIYCMSRGVGYQQR